MKFSEISKYLRQEHGFSQKQLGEKLNISAAAIGHLELGKHEPGSVILLAYANYFNVSVDYLLGRSEDNGFMHATSTTHTASNEITKNEQKLLDWYRGLPSDKARESFLSFIRSDSQYSTKRN